jgi:glyoxylase-like metal-dependent hydrolase (beta-lactamase superfamily II)
MDVTQATGGRIYGAHVQLTPAILLNVYLVKGDNYAVWIDSGTAQMFPLFLETMQAAGVTQRDLRFILHTHSHHDHIGSNGQLTDATGCLVAAHPMYAAWHADFEVQYQELARPFPHLMPDTPELREEVLGILDHPHPIDLFIDEGVQFNLGGVSLRPFLLPGHMLVEFGWFEETTRTLILGDAVTGLDWPIFHSHLSVSGYRDTLDRVAQLVQELDVQLILFAHFPPMRPTELAPLLIQARAYINEIEATILAILGEGPATLEQLWHATCARMDRGVEFRSLNMVKAHIDDLVARDLARVVGDEQYSRTLGT